jgi:cyclin H
MLAALSLADRGLAERIIQETFHHGPSTDDTSAPQNGEAGKENRKSGASSEEKKARVILGAEMRDKVLAAVEACREMLAREAPERMTEYWGTVSSCQAIYMTREVTESDVGTTARVQ